MANPDIPDRIREVRKALGGLTQPEFAQGMGVSRATVAGIETGKSNLTFDQLQSLLFAYNVNPIYLLTGEGGIFLRSKSYTASPLDSEVNDPMVRYEASRGTPLVPISAQAGYSLDAQVRDDLPIVKIPGIQDDHARVFEVAGESMIPVLTHGDFIACRKVASEHDLRDGLLYVVVARNHGVSVKYVRRANDHIRCTPHNTTAFTAFNVPLDEVLELWEVQIRITRNILSQVLESTPVRLQARFERLEKVMEHLLAAEEDRKTGL